MQSAKHVQTCLFAHEKSVFKYIHSKAFGGYGLGTFWTLKVFHLVTGFGDPSSDLQVRVMLCPYWGCPSILQIGGEGGTEKKNNKKNKQKRKKWMVWYDMLVKWLNENKKNPNVFNVGNIQAENKTNLRHLAVIFSHPGPKLKWRQWFSPHHHWGSEHDTGNSGCPALSPWLCAVCSFFGQGQLPERPCLHSQMKRSWDCLENRWPQVSKRKIKFLQHMTAKSTRLSSLSFDRCSSIQCPRK